MGFSRRDFGRMGGAALLSALAARGGTALAAGAGRASADPLAHVAPELRASAQQVLAMMASMPGFNDATIVEARKGGAAFVQPPLADVPVMERKVPGSRGQPDVAVQVINARAGGSRPGILHTHGGGYILGTAKGEVRPLQELARTLDCVIVSVEYRLAPETRFTGSVEDNYAGLLWMYRSAAELGVDPKRIALLGESAGGGHAALLAIAARDRGEVPLVLQALIYPMLDDRTGSTRQTPPFIGSVGWDAKANRYGWKSFLGVEPGGADVPAAGVPARVEKLEGLAPAFIAVGGIDLFVSEDIEYARRLTEAGVPAELLVVPGAYHGFDRMAADTPQARQFTGAKLNALRRAFGQPAV
ncbi:alpha/beta hydrolase [Sphingomonas canadensis]|uniref:Alpha/beta hydrolase n=1 Tax=Sphingomonas canadensis TaxID=1219257 RepID=A0ABW3H943_9SPHN|nr:alpha/beta hydrolase [Sphingomonas canadensis]MCW3837650.1 alpha/beta hydrolase [Sphingomonas canadensis]